MHVHIGSPIKKEPAEGFLQVDFVLLLSIVPVVLLLLLRFSAIRASLRFIGESLFLIESLLAFCKYECYSAIFAY